METKQTLDHGAAAAAILAAGIGSFAFGLAVCFSHAIKAVENFFTFSAPVGPLSGKTDAAVIIWLASWLILGLMWKGRQVSLARVLAAALVLTALGILGTFPPFFDLI